MRRKRFKRLSGLMFFLPAAIQKAVPFLVLPLLTSLVSPEAYGQMVLLTTVFLLGTTVFGLGMDTAIFYTSHRGSRFDIRENTGNAARVLVFAPIALSAVCAAVVAADVLPPNSLEPTPLALTILSSGIFVSGNVFASSTYRIRGDLRRFGVLVVGFSVVQQGTKVLLIASEHDPNLSWALGDFAGSVFVLGVSLPLLYASIRRSRCDRERSWALLRRALPLVPSRISQWALQMSDRALVVALLGASAGGIYGLAVQLGALSSIFVIEICRFTLPKLAQAGGEGSSSLWIHKIVPLQFVASACLASGVAFAGPVLLGLLFDEQYAAAAGLIPAIAAGACIAGWFYSLTDFIAVTLGSTGKLWLFTLAGAIVCLSANAIFLARYGLAVAAVSTILAYGTMTILALIAARRGLKDYRALTRLTSGYSLVVLALILASVPFASTDNFALTFAGLLVCTASGILVLRSHHRSTLVG